ncbi:hypothetical protein GF325_04510 [Candidatus Bathyarchaeota archaeon]|nr:hypothetical protein [Candidatus Bathyarchaeota archaeon]
MITRESRAIKQQVKESKDAAASKASQPSSKGSWAGRALQVLGPDMQVVEQMAEVQALPGNNSNHLKPVTVPVGNPDFP